MPADHWVNRAMESAQARLPPPDWPSPPLQRHRPGAPSRRSLRGGSMSAPIRLAVIASLAGAAMFATALAQPGPITTVIKTADGATIGSATLSDGRVGVLMRV